MESIKSISAFDSAYDLLEYVYGTDDIENGLSADEVEYLKSLNDYDYFKFFLLNDETVIVTESFGDVSGIPMLLHEFRENTISYVKENA